MYLCTYKQLFSKDNTTFEKNSTGQFKCHKKEDIQRVINNWNFWGAIKKVIPNVFWKYEIIHTERITGKEYIELWDNEAIPFRGNGVF